MRWTSALLLCAAMFCICCRAPVFQHHLWQLRVHGGSGRLDLSHAIWGPVFKGAQLFPADQHRGAFKGWTVTVTPEGWMLKADSPETAEWQILLSGDTLRLVSQSEAWNLHAAHTLEGAQHPFRSGQAGIVQTRLGRCQSGFYHGLRNRETGWTLTTLNRDTLHLTSADACFWSLTRAPGVSAQWLLQAPENQYGGLGSAWRVNAQPGAWREMVRELATLGRYGAPWGLEAVVFDLASDSLRKAAVDGLHTQEAWRVIAESAHKLGVKPVFLLHKEDYLRRALLLDPLLKQWEAQMCLATQWTAMDSSVSDLKLQAVLTMRALKGEPIRVGTPFNRTVYGRVAMIRRAWPWASVSRVTWTDVSNGPTRAIILTEAQAAQRCVLGLFDAVAHGTIERNIALLRNPLPFWMLDLWNENLIRGSGGLPPVSVPRGGCRLLLLQQAKPHPQYLCSDRHLTASLHEEQSIWKSGAMHLGGECSAWPGEARRLYVAVPPGWQVETVKANGRIAFQRRTGALLILALEGPAGKKRQSLKWSVQFTQGENPSFI